MMEEDYEDEEEEEEEIQTTPDHHQQQPAVTVAAIPPHQHQHQHQHILTLALPIQHPPPPPPPSGGASSGGREDCWSEASTATLIEAWGERYMELSRGNLKQQHWKEVADIVASGEKDYSKTSKTDVQCKNRIDTIKKKYKIEKAKVVSGQGPSRWIFFNRLDQLIGPNAKIIAGIANAFSNSRIPVAIPVQQGYHRHDLIESGTSSEDSLPPQILYPKIPVKTEAGTFKRKAGKRKNWGNSIRELSEAILEFGQAFERTERTKLEQVVEMEKQRMGFAKDLELQRMHFFMKTQLELTQLKNGKKSWH